MVVVGAWPAWNWVGQLGALSDVGGFFLAYVEGWAVGREGEALVWLAGAEHSWAGCWEWFGVQLRVLAQGAEGFVVNRVGGLGCGFWGFFGGAGG